MVNLGLPVSIPNRKLQFHDNIDFAAQPSFNNFTPLKSSSLKKIIGMEIMKERFKVKGEALATEIKELLKEHGNKKKYP